MSSLRNRHVAAAGPADEPAKDRYGNQLNESFAREKEQSSATVVPRASPEVSIDDEEQQMLVDGIVHLDDLADEDKFFLIQQIEDLNKNIRYTCKQEDIFQDDQELTGDDGYNERRAKRYNRSSLRNRTRKLDVILDEDEDQGDDGSDNGKKEQLNDAEQDALRSHELSPL